MHLGQLANCFIDFNDDRAVLQVQNDCIAIVTVLLQQQHKVPRQAQLPQQFNTSWSNNNVRQPPEQNQRCLQATKQLQGSCCSWTFALQLLIISVVWGSFINSLAATGSCIIWIAKFILILWAMHILLWVTAAHLLLWLTAVYCDGGITVRPWTGVAQAWASFCSKSRSFEKILEYF